MENVIAHSALLIFHVPFSAKQATFLIKNPRNHNAKTQTSQMKNVE